MKLGLVLLLLTFPLAVSCRHDEARNVMPKKREASSFFAEPLKAERAILSEYKADKLKGKFGIRIELAPISFRDPSFPLERDTEVLLEYLSLPSVRPTELQNTRFTPTQEKKSSFQFEGSVYFLGQHHQVDLKEIRFLTASENSILTEFDLVIHLPTSLPDEFPLTLTARTEVKVGKTWTPEASKRVEGLGVFRKTKDDLWECDGHYNGRPVRIELSTDGISFDEIASHARFVVAEQGIPPSTIRDDIEEGIEFLEWKFERFNVKPDFKVEDFVPRSFYFFHRRHHDEIEVIIVLDHPRPMGHWSLSYTGVENGHLRWTPKRDLIPEP